MRIATVQADSVPEQAPVTARINNVIQALRDAQASADELASRLSGQHDPPSEKAEAQPGLLPALSELEAVASALVSRIDILKGAF